MGFSLCFVPEISGGNDRVSGNTLDDATTGQFLGEGVFGRASYPFIGAHNQGNHGVPFLEMKGLRIGILPCRCHGRGGASGQGHSQYD